MSFVDRRGDAREIACIALILFLLAVLGIGSASAQVMPVEDWHKRQNADERLTAFGDDMFGDGIDPHTGGITFTQTDVSLPGNSNLEVAITRRRSQGVLPAGGGPAGEFGDWEYVVPRLKVTTAWNRPWTGNRCTTPFNTMFSTVVHTGSQQIYRNEYSNGVIVEAEGKQDQLLETPLGAQWPTGTKFTTISNWYFTCGSASDGGQGFIGHSPNGNTYRFDKVIVVGADPMPNAGNFELQRNMYIIAATEVTDVNGNWVHYDYDGTGNLTQISSNDGRSITLNYAADCCGGYLVQSVTANGRTWTYGYGGLTYYYPMWRDLYGSNAPGFTLTNVTLPDGRYWLYSLDGMAASTAPHPNCFENYTISVKHPAGATATFQLSLLGHRYVFDGGVKQKYTGGAHHGGICPVEYGPDGNPFPIYTTVDAVTTQVMSVLQKEVTGPSIATQTWTYEYEQDHTAGTSTSDRTNWTKVTGPGIHITYYHKWVAEPEGGALVKREVRETAAGPILETDDYQYSTENALGTQANYALIPPVGSAFARQPRRATQSQITRGTDWWRTINTFDSNFASATYSFGAPLAVARDSNVSTTPRATTTVYLHKKPIWVLALPDTVSVNGRTINQYHYDTLGRLSSEDLYGVQVGSYVYHTTPAYAGAVYSFTDGIGRVSYALNWKRGTPQQITQADATNVYQTINDDGWLMSSTDAKGFVTSYARDTMGRLTSYTPTGWTPTTVAYSFGSTTTQTITKGAGQTTITYDNLWRPTLVKTQDTGTGWSSYVNSTYDGLNRKTFESYPSTSSTSTSGIATAYDGIGRTLTSTAPGATTTFQYLNGHVRRVIDPVGNQTDSYFTGYDGPDSKEVIRILQPLTTNTYINRNVWGEIDSVQQGGTQNGYTVNFTQYHYYDSQRRRCGYSTPEAGDTLFAYNNAGEMTSYQKGATGASSCAVPSGTAMVTLSYDLMGRPTTTNYVDPGTPDVTRGYDPNGNLTSVSRGGTAWAYAYNALNLLTQETMTIDGRTYQTDYGYNLAGQETQMTFPGGSTIAYSPNGFGWATQAGGYATGVQYHPNGAVSTFNYGNGYVFVQTLTARQKSYQITSTNGGGTKASDLTFGYTANDQISSIVDLADPGNNRSFTYDGLSRMLTSTGQWGSGSYVYDAVGNLRQRSEGARIVETVYNGSTDRLDQVRDTATGNVWHGYSYDSRGSVTYDAVGLTTIGYDYSDQPTSLSGPVTASFVYDGNFRRAKQVVGGQTTYSVYSKSGELIQRDNITSGKRVNYIIVGKQQVAEVTNAGVATYFHDDQLGSPISSTSASGAVLWREQYRPYGESLQNDAAHADDIGFTGHIEDAPGLTYMQARYYDPVIGRFLAPDPSEFSPDRPYMFNRFAYVGNDPLNRIDPDGKQDFGQGIGVPAANGDPDWQLRQMGTDARLGPPSAGVTALGVVAAVACVEACGAIAVVGGAKAAVGGSVGGLVGGIASALKGNDLGTIAIDAAKSAGTSIFTSTVGSSVGSETKVAAETVAAYAGTKATGGSDFDAAAAAVVTGLIGMATNNPDLAAQGPALSALGKSSGQSTFSAVARQFASKGTSTVSKEAAKQGCKAANGKPC